jgi:hypothetical protein
MEKWGFYIAIGILVGELGTGLFLIGYMVGNAVIWLFE